MPKYLLLRNKVIYLQTSDADALLMTFVLTYNKSSLIYYNKIVY